MQYKESRPTKGAKIEDKLKGFLNAEKGRETLIIHRNQGLLDTPKMCFDTFRPVNVVNSDLNHSFTSNLSANNKVPFVSEMEFSHFSGVCLLNK